MDLQNLQDELIENIWKLNETCSSLKGGVVSVSTDDVTKFIAKATTSQTTYTTYQALKTPLLFVSLLFPGIESFAFKKQLLSQKLIQLLSFFVIILLLYFFIDQEALKFEIRDKTFPLNLIEKIASYLPYVGYWAKDGIESYKYFVESLQFSKLNFIYILNWFFKFLSDEYFYNIAYPKINSSQKFIQEVTTKTFKENVLGVFESTKLFASKYFKTVERLNYEDRLRKEKFISDIIAKNFSFGKSVNQLDIALNTLSFSAVFINGVHSLISSTLNLMFYKTVQALKEGPSWQLISTRSIIKEKQYYEKDDTVFAGTVNWKKTKLPLTESLLGFPLKLQLPYSYTLEEYKCMEDNGTSHPPKSGKSLQWKLVNKIESKKEKKQNFFNYFTLTNGILVGVIGIIFGIVSQEERSKNLYILNEETQKVELNSIYLGFMLYNFFQLVYLVSSTGIFRLGSKKLEIADVDQFVEEKPKSSKRKLKIR